MTISRIVVKNSRKLLKGTDLQLGNNPKVLISNFKKIRIHKVVEEIESQPIQLKPNDPKPQFCST